MQSSQEKRKKNAFCATVRKKCEKTVFFTFFETLCTKFAKKSVFFARRFAKSMSVLSRFSRQFVQSSQKIRKMSVFWVFFKTFPKKCEKTVFFHVFRDTLYKVHIKYKKTAFFELFARRFAKSVRKQCFFTSFWTLCQSSQKKRFFCATLCKKCECSFTFFKTLCTKFAEKEKNQRFLCFFCNFRENSVLSRFSRHFVQSSQKMRKTAFFELFDRRSTKSLRRQCIFTFFETLCA